MIDKSKNNHRGNIPGQDPIPEKVNSLQTSCLDIPLLTMKRDNSLILNNTLAAKESIGGMDQIQTRGSLTAEDRALKNHETEFAIESIQVMRKNFLSPTVRKRYSISNFMSRKISFKKLLVRSTSIE